VNRDLAAQPEAGGPRRVILSGLPAHGELVDDHDVDDDHQDRPQRGGVATDAPGSSTLWHLIGIFGNARRLSL
jgi:hypothetical protein